MKRIVLFFLAICLTGCAGIKPVYLKYTADLIHVTESSKEGVVIPVKVGSFDNKYAFEDSFVLTEMFFTPVGINFTINNKTAKTIKILWDDAAFIEKDGTASKVMHNGIKYTDRNNSMPPTIIPANGKIEETATPTNRIVWVQGYYSRYGSTPGYWNNQGIFDYLYMVGGITGIPVENSYEDTANRLLKAAEKNIGSKIGLLLPIQMKDITKEYTFTFEVKSVHLNKE
jgi:hypothetical protein